MDFFDLDGSGTIDGYEFACALTLLCDGKPREKAELLFSFYDFDGNQYLSHEEVIILMTNCATGWTFKKSIGVKIYDFSEFSADFFDFLFALCERHGELVHSPNLCVILSSSGVIFMLVYSENSSIICCFLVWMAFIMSANPFSTLLI